MKFLLMIIFVLLCVNIASRVSKKFKEEYLYYSDFMDFINEYEINVMYKKEKLQNFIKKLQKNSKFGEILTNFYENLQKNQKINYNYKLLSKSENDFLNDSLNSLGGYDSDREEQNLKSIKLKVEKYLATAKENLKFCPVIVKLALLLSIGLCIIFI